MRFMRKSRFDEPINKVLDEMSRLNEDSEAYSEHLKHLDKLTQLKERERSSGVDLNTVCLVAGNLLGILVIVAYEQKHVMASRGMNFILRPKTD